MPESRRDRIIKTAKEILNKEPAGLRTAQIVQGVRDILKDDKRGLHGALLQYAKQPGAAIYQPARGWFRLTQFQDDVSASPAPNAAPSEDAVYENAFYQPFADYLENDLEECTKAIPVGHNKLKDKFGTPDVVGVLKPSATDVIKFPVEIVSAEIKVSVDGLITAFGQACSYRLFSHKCYIVVPRTASGSDIDRLESLCMLFGIGLILFDPASPATPAFQIRTRAVRHEPDGFYVNQKIVPIAKELLD